MANLESISHRCYLRKEAFEWELTKDTIYLPLGCLQGGDLESLQHLRLQREREEESGRERERVRGGRDGWRERESVCVCAREREKEREIEREREGK